MKENSLSKREFLAQMYQILQKSNTRLEKEEWATIEMLTEVLENQRMQDAARELDAAIYTAYEQSRRQGYSIGDMILTLEKAIGEARSILKSIDFGVKRKSDAEVVVDLCNCAMGNGQRSNRFFLQRFPSIENASDGLYSGYYVFVGAPGVGKTAFVQNIMLDALDSNSNAVVHYYSFDDMKGMIIQRFIALYSCIAAKRGDDWKANATGIRYVAMPARNHSAQKILEQAHAHIGNLIAADRLRIFDRSDILTMSELRNHIAQSKHNNPRFIAGVDSVLRIDCTAAGLRGVDLDDYRADCLDEIAGMNDIPLLTSHEQRKRNTDEKAQPLTIEDTKGSGRYGYNAKFGVMVYPSDRKKFKEGQDNTVVAYVDKSKVSEETGGKSYLFNKAYSHLEEVVDGNLENIGRETGAYRADNGAGTDGDDL